MNLACACHAAWSAAALAVGLSACASPAEREPVAEVAAPRTAAPRERTPAQLDLPALEPRVSQAASHPPAPEPPLAVEQQAAPAPSADAGVVTALIAAQYVAFGARDWAAFESGFWPGATIVTIRKPPDGSADTVVSTPVGEYVAEFMQNSANTVQIEMTMSEHRIEVDGIVAHALVRFSAQTVAPAELHRWHGTDAFLFIRHADQWRVACMAFGSPSFDD
jgi:hypothetical protein